MCVAYTLLLGCAVRFVHFALFEGTLLSPASYGADTRLSADRERAGLADDPRRPNGDAILLAL